MVRDGRMMVGFESPAMLWGACAPLTLGHGGDHDDLHHL